MPSDSAPAWLFSFVDLAFLLLIAMTQIGADSDPLDLGEIIVPRIQAGATTELPSQAAAHWQLRVHPPDDGVSPFELTRPGLEAAAGEAVRIDAPMLRQRLAELRGERAGRPLLAPHGDSRTQDLLDAAGLVEEFWPTRRRATVAPVFAKR